MTNGCEIYENEEYLDHISEPVTIKPEPLSEDEMPSDLPMNCMLCTKSFHTILGLRAHVLSKHSYKTVKRKVDGSVSPAKPTQGGQKYVCDICKRSFTTSTDLKVHEVCHNKFSCFACQVKFDSFEQVARHRRRCKVKNPLVKPKTLIDILKERVAKRQSEMATESEEEISTKDIIDEDKTHNAKRILTRSPNRTTDIIGKKSEKDSQKEMIEIEINVKQEIKDDKENKEHATGDVRVKNKNNEIKKEPDYERVMVENKEIKKEVDYKKIETELESIFVNSDEESRTNIKTEGTEKKPDSREILNEGLSRNNEEKTVEAILRESTASNTGQELNKTEKKTEKKSDSREISKQVLTHKNEESTVEAILSENTASKTDTSTQLNETEEEALSKLLSTSEITVKVVNNELSKETVTKQSKESNNKQTSEVGSHDSDGVKLLSTSEITIKVFNNEFLIETTKQREESNNMQTSEDTTPDLSGVNMVTPSETTQPVADLTMETDTSANNDQNKHTDEKCKNNLPKKDKTENESVSE